MGALRVLNPALRPPIWNGSRWVPRGYRLRLPGTLPHAEIAAAWERLPPAQRYLAQRSDGSHRIRRGETLVGIAAASGVSLSRLLAANGWSADHSAVRGETVRIPPPATRAEGAGAPPAAVAAMVPTPAADALAPEAAPESLSPQAVLTPKRPPKEPVSQRQTESAALLPAAAPTGNGDATDYSVGAGDTVTVQAAETLGHYADWLGVSSEMLRTLNKLHKKAMVTLGHRVKLDFSKVTPEQFEATRREYHQHLQEDYFAAHRIAGTENYSVKHGDSLWVIAQQHGDLPVWLVTQYNPDVDFSDVRPGTVITLPQVAAINRQ
jgi:membrane-bound lytic murein transglycosylase D